MLNQGCLHYASALLCTSLTHAMLVTDVHAPSTAPHEGLPVMPQVLTIHSPLSVENATSYPLQLTLQRAAPAYDCHGTSTGGGAACTVPADGPLAPGAQCFLPQPDAWWVSSLLRDVKPLAHVGCWIGTPGTASLVQATEGEAASFARSECCKSACLQGKR